jgi:LPXTG-motif cell wall-anchored protein
MTDMACDGRRTGRRRTAVLAAFCLLLAFLLVPDAIQADDPAVTPPATDPGTVTETPPTEGTPPTEPGTTEPTPPTTDPTDPTDPTTAPPATVPEQATTGAAVPVAKADTAVTVADFSYTPESITISVGDSVTWTNQGEEVHDAVALDGSFNTGHIDPGSSGSATFSSAGSFRYVCSLHPTLMKGTVVVSGSSGGGGTKDTSGTGDTGSGTTTTTPTTEAAATASPTAAGTDSSLPSTGSNELAATLLGVALMAAGLLIRTLVRRPG